ncbi:MAG: TetR/AcrR family transcriptional regulator [Kofleriaceae bacterium]|nr:MAG: TetR/AcrR family transcriptional regulator [Kofleriaceae bacterium]MBZ0235827.1 TetR/AcrR family transcriptional regulator [Kofleriaceae bacterium]
MTPHSPKRDRILDAAERVFAQRGFFTAKVADIAKEAGVADGTIYLYFKSKDDLLISLFESRMERVNALLGAAVAAAKTPHEKLMAFVRAYIGMIADQPTAAEVLTIELRQSTKFMREYSAQRFGELLRLLAGVIAEGQASGEWSDAVPAPHAARMIWGMLDEMALAWLLGRDHGGRSSSGRGRKPPPSVDDGGRKFDIVRAADWVGALVTQGLERRSHV